jgi:hypothetical protein
MIKPSDVGQPILAAAAFQAASSSVKAPAVVHGLSVALIMLLLLTLMTGLHFRS